jgi:hypothetical protein
MKSLVTLDLQQLSPCQCGNQDLQLLDPQLVRKLDQTPTGGNYSSHEIYLHDKKNETVLAREVSMVMHCTMKTYGSMEIKVDRY